MRESQTPPRGKLEAVRLTEAIFEGLRKEIIGGELKPGELLSRRRIAGRFGCSYTPVIEALVRLEHAGLVESQSHRMARVRGLSAGKILDDYVLREAYETQAIRLACRQATAAEVKELRRLAARVDSKRSKVGAGARINVVEEASFLDWQFHRRVAEVSRCGALVRQLEGIETQRRLQAKWITVVESNYPERHHEVLVDALERRDPLAADAAMRAHVRRGLEREIKGYLTAQSPLLSSDADVGPDPPV
jgi:DNA-binding GntR family transcriptional regulator